MIFLFDLYIDFHDRIKMISYFRFSTVLDGKYWKTILTLNFVKLGTFRLEDQQS